MSTNYSYPGQAFLFTLNPLKGWYEEGALDAMCKLSSNVNIGSAGLPAHSGLCVHVTGHITSPDVYGGVINGPGQFEVELGCKNGHGVPMFLWSGSNEPDIYNPGVTAGVPVYGNTDYGPPDQVSVFPQVNGQAIPALVATGGYELEIVGVYDQDQVYTVNNLLRAVTHNTNANGGRLTNQLNDGTDVFTSTGATVNGNPAVAAWDTIVGVVSRSEYVTGNKKNGIAFWSVWLPGTR